jgi:NhaP-type Na+/H+ and K+/H+ antiporter
MMSESYQGIAIVALAVVMYLTAEGVEGDGFIAVFIGGMFFGNRLQHSCNF